MALVAVTGGAGFIGRALVAALLERGDTVRVLDDGSRSRLSFTVQDGQILKFVQGDVRDYKCLVNLFESCDRVYHLAAINGTKNFYERPKDVLDVGIRGTLNAVDAAISNGVKEFLFMSSSEVYQTPSYIPTSEDAVLTIPDVTNPRYSYGGGKIAGELICLHFGRDSFDRMVIYRPHNIYGANMGLDHVIPELTRRIVQTIPDKSGVRNVKIQGDGKATRAFCHISDFVDGCLLVSDKGEHQGIYHLGTDEEVSILTLANLIADELNVPTSFYAGDSPIGQTRRRCPDVSRARSLGYNPTVSLREGLRIVVPRIVQDVSAGNGGDRLL